MESYKLVVHTSPCRPGQPGGNFEPGHLEPLRYTTLATINVIS